MKLSFKQKKIDFAFPVGTSRGILTQKKSYFFILEDASGFYVSECPFIVGLSRDRLDNYKGMLEVVCMAFNRQQFDKIPYDLVYTHPSIQFGLECLVASLKAKQNLLFTPNAWQQGQCSISINGLIWMQDINSMTKQVYTKVEQGMSCIKIKIGQHDFDKELAFLKHIRKTFKDIILRLDANGAFLPEEALAKLKKLAFLDIHSIEQPIAPNNWEVMADLCAKSPIPIALDEELVLNFIQKKKMLQTLKPSYIVLKPSILGGFVETNQWIKEALSQGVDYWITSALETVVGLSFISQWTSLLEKPVYHGLGTGQIFQYPYDHPLYVDGDKLCCDPEKNWDLSFLYPNLD